MGEILTSGKSIKLEFHHFIYPHIYEVYTYVLNRSNLHIDSLFLFTQLAHSLPTEDLLGAC